MNLSDAQIINEVCFIARKETDVKTQKFTMELMVENILGAMVNFMRVLFVSRNLSAELKQLLVTSSMRIVGSYGIKKNPGDIDVECWRLDYQSVIKDLIKIYLLTGLKVHCFCYGYDWFFYKETSEYRILCAPKWIRILHKTIWSNDLTRKKR